MAEIQEPPIKKIKMENVTLSEATDYYIEKIKQCTNSKAVLDDELVNPLPLIKVAIGHVKTPKMISKVISLLGEKLPLKNLSHLKRARGKDILLCPTRDLNGLAIQCFIELNVPELQDAFDYFKEIAVPATAPKVKRQFSGMQLWSLNFHPNKYLESLAGDNFFTRDQMKFHITCMSMVFEAVRWHLKFDSSPELLKKVNATIVVDPSIYSIVAVAFCNKDHPIQHAAMLAIDNVAKTQNGGAWGKDTKEAVDCTLSGINRELQIHLKQEFRQISFGARVFKSKRVANTSDSDKPDQDVSDTSESPYLCTGYNVYTLREPCIMCAMALVHARAKRIFFCFDNTQFGALKSKAKLQTIQSLNHRFEVFTGFLSQDNN